MVVTVFANLLAGGCGDDDPPTHVTPPPDYEADGCAPWSYYTDGAVPGKRIVSWITEANDIAFAGDDLVLAGGDGGVYVLDPGLPTGPRIIGQVVIGNATRLDVQGTLVAVAADDFGFALVDISDPTQPHLLAQRQVVGPSYMGGSAGQTYHVALHGDDLFVAGTYHQVVRFDVSNPCEPREVGRFDLGTEGAALLVVDEFLYIGVQTVLAVGDATMTLAATLGEGGAWDLVRRGNFVHAATGGQLVTVSVADPAAPVVTDRRTLAGAVCLAVSGDRVFVGGENSGLSVYDFFVPDSPRLVANALGNQSVLGLALRNGFLYHAGGWQYGWLDVSDPEIPMTEGLLQAAGRADAFAVTDAACVVAFNRAICVYPRSGDLAAEPLATLPEHVDELAASGSLIYLTRADGGLQVLDVTDPTHPQLSTVFYSERNFGLLDPGPDLLAAASSGAIYLYGLADPQELVPLGIIPLAEQVNALDLAGDRLLVSLEDSHLVLFDVGDPAEPVELARDDDNPYFCRSRRVLWLGDRALDLHGENCCVLRLAVPDQNGVMTTVTVLDLGDRAHDLVLHGSVAYVLGDRLRGTPSRWQSDLAVVDANRTTDLTLLGVANRPMVVYDSVRLEDGFVFALDGTGIDRYWPECQPLTAAR